MQKESLVLVFVNDCHLVFFLVDILVDARVATWHTLSVLDASVDVVLGKLNDFNDFFFLLHRFMVDDVMIFVIDIANHLIFKSQNLISVARVETEGVGDQAELV